MRQSPYGVNIFQMNIDTGLRKHHDCVSLLTELISSKFGDIFINEGDWERQSPYGVNIFQIISRMYKRGPFSLRQSPYGVNIFQIQCSPGVEPRVFLRQSPYGVNIFQIIKKFYLGNIADKERQSPYGVNIFQIEHEKWIYS